MAKSDAKGFDWSMSVAAGSSALLYAGLQVQVGSRQGELMIAAVGGLIAWA